MIRSRLSLRPHALRQVHTNDFQREKEDDCSRIRSRRHKFSKAHRCKFPSTLMPYPDSGVHRPRHEDFLRVHFSVRLGSFCLVSNGPLSANHAKGGYLCGVALLRVFGVLAVGRCGSTLGCPAALDGPHRACVCVESATRSC